MPLISLLAKVGADEELDTELGIRIDIFRRGRLQRTAAFHRHALENHVGTPILDLVQKMSGTGLFVSYEVMAWDPSAGMRWLRVRKLTLPEHWARLLQSLEFLGP